jgi:hypothetical protein
MAKAIDTHPLLLYILGLQNELMVHSHLMFKSLLNEILGGILSGTQC